MHTRHYCVVAFVFVMCCASLLVTRAQTPPSSSSQPPTAAAPTAPPAAATQPSASEAALRAEIDTIRAYQDQFISIVQWSLGTVVAVAFALAAFSWWQNRTAGDRDREALRQELRAHITTDAAAIAQELTKKLDARQTAIQQAVEKNVNETVAKVAAQAVNWAVDVNDLQRRFVAYEASSARKEARHTWALYKYCELLRLCAKAGADYTITETLDEIREIVKTPGLSLDADDITETVETLKGLPSRYHAATEKLIEAVKSLGN